MFQRIVRGIGKDRDTPAWRLISKMRDVLKENRIAGEGIEKNRIPKYYKDMYGVNNLYRYHLSSQERTCYTLQKVNGSICAIILEYFENHKEYDKRFRVIKDS